MFNSNITFGPQSPIDWKTAGRSTIETEWLNIVAAFEAVHCCTCDYQACCPALPMGECGSCLTNRL